MISATLALMMQTNPSLKPEKIVDLLYKTSDSIYNINPKFVGKLGKGRVNVQSAILAVQALKETESADILLFNDSETKGQIKRVTAKGIVKAKFKTFDNLDVNVASGDFNGDKKIEIAVTPKQGASPEVRIYQEDGKLLNKFLAFESNFKGGVNLSAGDINGDGLDELVLASGNGRVGEIKILDKNFKLKKNWQPYGSGFKNGVNLAVGDSNGDKKIEIISAPASKSGSHIKIFNGNGGLVSQFFAFKNVVGGFKVAVSDAYSSINQTNSLVITSDQEAYPYIHFFDYRGKVINEFFAYGGNSNKNISIATADLDNDGQDEIITGAGDGSGPLLTLYKSNGSLIKAFYTDKKTLTRGVSVASFIKK
jgi:hypothetical protein